LKAQLRRLAKTRLLLSSDLPKAPSKQRLHQNAAFVSALDPLAAGLLGDEHDRARRNTLQLRGLAGELLLWLEQKAQVRAAPGKLPSRSSSPRAVLPSPVTAR
jgi:hypothetical protein